MSEIMALYGPGSRIDGYPRHARNTPPPTDRRLRLEHGLERLHALFLEMAAKWIDAVDAETADADLEPSLAMREESTFPRTMYKGYFDRTCGSTTDQEADGGYWSNRCGDSDYEPSLGAPEATSTLNVVKFGRSQLRRQRIRVVTELGLDQRRWNRGEGDHDDEPSLAIADGARTGVDHRIRISPHINEAVQDADLEDQCEDGDHKDSDFEPEADDEPDADDEPSLGAPEGAQGYGSAPRTLEEVDAELNGMVE